ncbi:MAG: hypothetical protein ACLR23_09930 [Clostridia bacterium]
MESLMKYISRTHRPAGQYRGTGVPCDGINSCQHIYIFQVCKNPGISQDQLSKLICVEQKQCDEAVERLRTEWILSLDKPDPRDRRVLQVFPTEKALQLFPQVRSIMREWNHLLLEDFTEEEQKSLLSMLERITEKAMAIVEKGEIVGYANDLSVLKALCAPYEPRPIHKIYWNHYAISCSAWILSCMIDDVVPQERISLILLWGGVMLLCSAAAVITNIVANRMASWVAQHTTEAIRHDLFTRISYLSCKQIDDLPFPPLNLV